MSKIQVGDRVIYRGDNITFEGEVVELVCLDICNKSDFDYARIKVVKSSKPCKNTDTTPYLLPIKKLELLNSGTPTVVHNGVETPLSKLNSEQLFAYYNHNPFQYYQQYVKASVSPYYDLKLAALGAAEELAEFMTCVPDEYISEAGDFLFQLFNIANFANIELTSKLLDTVPSIDSDNLQKDLVLSFKEILGCIMKMTRYPDYEAVFLKKWGMTAAERIKTNLITAIQCLDVLLVEHKLTLRQVMDYNLEKLDKRHSEVEGAYYFGSGLGLTRIDGGKYGRD